jgi:hypothetical protein
MNRREAVNERVIQVLNQIWEEDFPDFSYVRNGPETGHDHMEQFVRHRIGDERLVRLILKWLKAGVTEDGR